MIFIFEFSLCCLLFSLFFVIFFSFTLLSILDFNLFCILVLHFNWIIIVLFFNSWSTILVSRFFYLKLSFWILIMVMFLDNAFSNYVSTLIISSCFQLNFFFVQCILIGNFFLFFCFYSIFHSFFFFLFFSTYFQFYFILF